MRGFSGCHGFGWVDVSGDGRWEGGSAGEATCESSQDTSSACESAQGGRGVGGWAGHVNDRVGHVQ